MRTLRAFGRFWYDFVIGDDWKIAAGVVCALGLSWTALRLRLLGDHWLAALSALAVMAFFALGLAVDVRGARRRGPAGVSPPAPPR